MASQSQNSQTQDSTVDDPRLAELLKPIKDLTQNWEVPLAEILSGYLEEMSQMTISLDGGHTNVNFAQAALVLQGTTSVWSKKVDFLWKFLEQTLELLRNKEREGGNEGDGESSGAKTGRKRQGDLTREFERLVADLGKNLDIKTDEEETVEDRKQLLNFIYVTPRQLIEKEGSEQKAVKVNLYMGVAQAKWELLAAKEDFRINGQFGPRGYLGEELNVDNQYLNLVAEDTVGGDMSTAPDEEGQAQEKSPACLLHPDIHENGDMSVGGGDNMGHHDDDDLMDASVTSERAAGHNASAADHLALASPPPFLDPASPSAHRARSPSPKAPWIPELVVDTWTPLNPHESMTTPKPIKVKKTLKLPPSMRNQKSNKPLPPLPSISDYLNEEMSSHSHRFGSFAMVPAALSDLAHQEYERRKDRDREQRRERLNQREEARRNIFANDEEDIDHGFDGYEDNVEPAGNVDDVNEEYNEDQDYHDIGDDDFDLPNPHIGGEVGPLVAGEINSFLNGDDDQENETLSYEEMVARKVEEYVTQSQDYMRSSELARKVAAWHEMIGPRLETVEKRIAFDIHAYGSKIINNFTSQRSEVPFNTVVGGQKPEEVSRFFLSTLMLANTGNIEISTADETDPFLGMDNVQLKLLSTARHHQQLEEFQPLSQASGDVSNVENEEIVADVSRRGEKRNPTFREPSSPMPKKVSKKKRM